MSNRAGLRKVTKTVRGSKGAVRRSYWVKAKSFASRHKRKIALGFAGGVLGAVATGLAIRKGILNRQTSKFHYDSEKVKESIRNTVGRSGPHYDIPKAKETIDRVIGKIRSSGSATTAPPNTTSRTIINPVVAARTRLSKDANYIADAGRSHGARSGGAPLQLGSGLVAKAKRTPRKRK